MGSKDWVDFRLPDNKRLRLHSANVYRLRRYVREGHVDVVQQLIQYESTAL